MKITTKAMTDRVSGNGFLTACGLSVAFSIGAAGVTNAAIIDDFSDVYGGGGTLVSAAVATTSSATDDTGAGILGERDADLTLVSGIIGSSTSGFGGVATVNGGATVPGFTNVVELELLYDAFGSLDLSDGASAGFIEVVVPFFQGIIDFTASINGVAAPTQQLASAGPDGGVSLFFDFSDFATDLSDVTSFGLVVTTVEEASDVAIDSIEYVIPEPASLALVGAGALAMLSRRREDS